MFLIHLLSVIGLFTSVNGFVNGTYLYSGNQTDCATLDLVSNLNIHSSFSVSCLNQQISSQQIVVSGARLSWAATGVCNVSCLSVCNQFKSVLSVVVPDVSVLRYNFSTIWSYAQGSGVIVEDYYGSSLCDITYVMVPPSTLTSNSGVVPVNATLISTSGDNVSSGNSNVGAVVGGVFAVLFVLSLVVIVYLYRRKKRNEELDDNIFIDRPFERDSNRALMIISNPILTHDEQQ